MTEEKECEHTAADKDTACHFDGKCPLCLEEILAAQAKQILDAVERFLMRSHQSANRIPIYSANWQAFKKKFGVDENATDEPIVSCEDIEPHRTEEER